jgi:hypothetical protein
VYRGCAIPDLRGAYFYADINGRVWSFRYVRGAVTDFRERTSELAPRGGSAINTPVHIGEDARGEIYIVDLDGDVFRVVSRAPAPAVDLGFGKVGSNGRAPVFDACGVLNTGNTATLRLRFAPPNAVAVACYSLSSNPTLVLRGTFVPLPIIASEAFTTDAAGRVNYVVRGGSGPVAVYGQFLVDDPGLSELVGISNALRMEFLQ